MRRAAFLLAGVLMCSAAPSLWSQRGLPPIAPGEGDRERRRENEELERMQKENEKKLAKQRQEDLRKDTKKLVELANELQNYVDKTNENVLSLDVMKKAEQIEKLAHDVRSKMKAQ